MNFGQYIRQKRIERGLSQEQLGKILGKNKSTISRIENGDFHSVKTSILVPLAEALDVPLHELISFDENGIKQDVVIEKITKEEFAEELTTLLNKSDVSKDIEDKINGIINDINKM